MLPKATPVGEFQNSRPRTRALEQVSEMGSAVRPVCWGRGFSSWAGQVILQKAQDHHVESRNWHFLLVHPAQTCSPEPNRWGQAPGEKLPRGCGTVESGSLQACLASFSWAVHSRESKGEQAVHSRLTEKKLNQKPAWLVLWDAINSQGLAYAVRGHEPPH